MRRGGSRQITVYGSAASCGAIFRRCERTRRLSSLALRRDPIRPRPASRIGSSGPLTGSPENTPKRDEHLERALTLFQPGRDDDLAFRFGQDAGVAAMCYLAIASWPLGNVRRAVSLVDGAHERLASVAHIGTHPYAKLHAAMFELMRGDRARAAENGSETARLAHEHDLPLWRAYGAFFEGLAAAERGALSEGLSDMRRSAESLRQQNLLNFDGLFKIALAETEARAGDRDRAIAILDEALATADRLGYRAFEAELQPGARRNAAQVRPRQPRARRGGFPDGYRRREAARDAQFRTARGAFARQALPIDRPVPSTPTLSSRPRSKAFRRRRKCRRSPRRRRCWSV